MKSVEKLSTKTSYIYIKRILSLPISFTDCAITLTNTNGVITSPGYPHHNYHDRSDCTWLIQLSPGHIIEIVFISIRFVGYDFDYLEIFDGDSKTAPSLTKWGGLGIPSGFDYRNNIFKCDGDIKCDGDYKCQLDPNCNTGSMKASAVQLISGESSMLVTPEQ